jgi:ABC-type transport system substrate-binding protein
MDEDLLSARRTADQADRTELYERFASYLIAGAPAVPLYTPVWTYVQRRDVRGFETALLSSPALRFSSVAAWYVRTRVPD